MAGAFLLGACGAGEEPGRELVAVEGTAPALPPEPIGELIAESDPIRVSGGVSHPSPGGIGGDPPDWVGMDSENGPDFLNPGCLRFFDGTCETQVSRISDWCSGNVVRDFYLEDGQACVADPVPLETIRDCDLACADAGFANGGTCQTATIECGDTNPVAAYCDCEPNDDEDGDGFDVTEDCDDDEETVHPGAAEVCSDGVINDCDVVFCEDDPETLDCIDGDDWCGTYEIDVVDDLIVITWDSDCVLQELGEDDAWADWAGEVEQDGCIRTISFPPAGGGIFRLRTP